MINTKSCANVGFVFGFILLFQTVVFTQTTNTSYMEKAKFHDHIDSYLSMSVPVLNVHDLAIIYDEVLVFDIREKEEYEVSHLPGAIFIGSKRPNFDILEEIDKDQKIVVYCSIGYRSEKMGVKLNKRGFKNVYNLYGSIFSWVNEGKKLEDKAGKNTNNVHTYNRKWSKWVVNPDYKKVY